MKDKNNYWNSCLYPLFLSTLNSCTLASYDNAELQAELDNFAIRAIAKFKFPKIPLAYLYDESLVSIATEQKKGFYFVNDITPKEIIVILSWMKVYWLEYQLSKERNYENVYADKDVKAFSSASLINSIDKAYNTFIDFARRDEEDYGKVNSAGRPAIGDINV